MQGAFRGQALEGVQVRGFGQTAIALPVPFSLRVQCTLLIALLPQNGTTLKMAKSPGKTAQQTVKVSS